MEGAPDRALPQQGGRKSEGPQVVPRSVPDLERRKHSTGPTSPSCPTSTTRVCVLGSLPGPEGGISWGWLILYPSQTEALQQGATARGSRRASRHLEWRMFPAEPRAGFPPCVQAASLALRYGVGRLFPQTS